MGVYVQLVLILQVLLTSAENSNYKRFCYIDTSALHRSGQIAFTPEDIDANLCTHLSFAFATLDDTGTQLKATEPAHDPDMYMRFNAIKEGHSNLKTLLSVGGWGMGSELFTILVANDSNINTFANNAVKFLRDRGFDGLDVDWEFPASRGSPPEDKQRFTKLIKVLYQTFQTDSRDSGKKALILSAAVGAFPTTVTQSYEADELGGYLDIINLMTYDMHGEWDRPLITGHHSALYATTADPYTNIDYVTKYWTGLGVPTHKMLIGLPFYARTFSLIDTSVTSVGSAASGRGKGGPYVNSPAYLAYFEVCDILAHDGESHVSVNQSVPYLVDNERWGGYDDEKSLQAKVKYVIDNGFGGVMVWALDLDDYSGICGKRYPLINAVKDTFNSVVEK